MKGISINMSINKQIHFIRNIEELEKNRDESIIYEYEVIADANIIGHLEYGPYVFSMWEFSAKNEGEKRKLNLQIKVKKFNSDDLKLDQAERNGFYHGGGIAEEIIYLSSLFLRRRIILGPVTRIDDRPSLFNIGNKVIDKPLITGESNLGNLYKWLDLVKKLKPEYDQRFILASKLYHQSLQLIEEQPDLAYLNLVSSIEVLCQETDIGTVSLYDLDHKLADLIYSLDNDLKERIEKSILKREKFIKRKFVQFILDHIEDNFWKDNDKLESEYGAVKREDLKDYLERIYDQRSKTLHSGEPFPPNIFGAPLQNAEIDFTLGMFIGDKKWLPKDYIPYPHFFERLVNHVIISFLRRNQVKQ
jgi:hypothetical protein